MARTKKRLQQDKNKLRITAVQRIPCHAMWHLHVSERSLFLYCYLQTHEKKKYTSMWLGRLFHPAVVCKKRHGTWTLVKPWLERTRKAVPNWCPIPAAEGMVSASRGPLAGLAVPRQPSQGSYSRAGGGTTLRNVLTGQISKSWQRRLTEKLK